MPDRQCYFLWNYVCLMLLSRAAITTQTTESFEIYHEMCMFSNLMSLDTYVTAISHCIYLSRNLSALKSETVLLRIDIELS